MTAINVSFRRTVVLLIFYYFALLLYVKLEGIKKLFNLYGNYTEVFVTVLCQPHVYFYFINFIVNIVRIISICLKGSVLIKYIG